MAQISILSLQESVKIINFDDDFRVNKNVYPSLQENSFLLDRKRTRWFLTAQCSVPISINARMISGQEEIEVKDDDVIRIYFEQPLIIVFNIQDKHQTWDLMALDTLRQQFDIYNEDYLKFDTFPHAHIAFENNAWTLSDVNTINGVLVNGTKIENSQVIFPGDCIRIGRTFFFYQNEGLLYNKKVLEDHKLSIQIKERSAWSLFKKNILLKDIDLTIEPGNLVLILGGSGAGKSTFVNAITGYEKANAKIQDGDLDVYKNYDQMKYEIGFVPQQDLLRDDDTVIDTLRNAAEMRMSEDISDQEKESRVQEVLNLFGLGSVQTQTVDKLSGGQKKRLSIGVEFMADPSLFILDEPDSGLDGVLARELMEQLRKIANQNKIVLVITHSPDRVIDLFDQVIVLAKGTKDRAGQLAFYGSIGQARQFFQKKSMEEIVRLLNNTDEGGEGKADEYIEKYKHWQPQENLVEPKLEKSKKEVDYVKHSSRWDQVRIYLGKFFRIFFNNKEWLKLVMALIIAILISVVIGKNMYKFMEQTEEGALALSCLCIWNGFFNSIQVVCRERAIIKREHRAGLHITSYIAAQMIFQAILCAAEVIISMIAFKFCGMTFLDHGYMTGNFVLDTCISLFLITFAADMCALMISCIVKTTTTAMTVMPFLLIIQLVFAGIAFPLSGATEKASNFTISKWGIYTICSQAGYNDLPSSSLYTAMWKFSGNEYVMEMIQNIKQNHKVDDVNWESAKYFKKEEYSSDKKTIGRDWSMLAVMSFVFAGIGALFLKRIDKDRR